IDHDIFLERANANLTTIVRTTINTDSAFESDPSITSFANGQVWVSYTRQNTPDNADIWAGRVDAAGNLIDTITLFDFGNTRAGNSDLATLANGNFVAVATRDFLNSGDFDVFFTIDDINGNIIVPQTAVVGANSTAVETLPHVAALADGGFVVVWQDG